jgi:exosortase A-associated hydrolase 2
VLYVHPFAEEMNRARRMAALQARALAALGYGVLQIDLYGCGDSSGDFGDARWDLWKDDLAQRRRLAKRSASAAGHAVGTAPGRAARPRLCAQRLVIRYRPCCCGSRLSGPAFLTQFLRLRVASALLEEGAERCGTSACAQALRAGECSRSPATTWRRTWPRHRCARSARSLMPACPVHWFEALKSADGACRPARRASAPLGARAASCWTCTALPCPPFWTTPEITVGPEWLVATSPSCENKHDV